MYEKLSSKDLTGFIASQTLGGNAASESLEDEVIFKGGEFGGGGAGSKW